MKCFWKDNAGNAVVWAAFLMLILFVLSAVVYAGVTVYAQYQACETEVQRAATVTVDRNLLNANVRDLVLDVPDAATEESFYAGLVEAGWVLENGCWNRYEDRHTIYSLTDLSVDIESQTMRISATLDIPLPWGIGDISKVHLPMNIRSSVLYIE